MQQMFLMAVKVLTDSLVLNEKMYESIFFYVYVYIVNVKQEMFINKLFCQVLCILTSSA